MNNGSVSGAMSPMTSGPRTDAPHGMPYFGDSRCRSIWQWQLVLAFTVVAISVGVALLTPARFADWRFSVGSLAVIAISVISLAVPWHRLGQNSVLLLPLLDTLAISLMAQGGVAASAFLWVFPLAWVASYYSVTVLIGTLALIGLLRLINLFVLGITVETTINVVILLITLGFVGVIMAVGSERNRSSRRLLRAQSERLAHALGRVNEQKARNRRLLDSLDIGIARVGTGGLIEVSNDAFHTIFALDAAAQFHPTRAVEYHSRRGEPIPAGQTAIARASRGELFADEVVWLFGLDGQWRAVKMTTKAIGHGLITGDGLLLVVEDVTATIDPQAGREATRRMISHELRNPLTAVLGHIDLIIERPDIDDAVREQLEVVERAGERMQKLINNALTVPENTPDAAIDFDLADLARSSLEGFSPAADSAGVVLEAALDEKLCVCGDAFRLRQVVDNIVSNAIKYAQRGGRVSVEGFRPGIGEVGLRISDTGIGIAEEDIPRIFEREFRTQAARDSGIPGTGLGLSISRDIVVEQSGHLDVQSEIGQGTTVTVVLPAAQQLSHEGTSA
ncbi:HAMP domain-containing histidine kinase [Microbacterium aerolatum]|uniref:sensor histidine kinase n=1 Tax=Microbacterium aerolatum TaxID=153731 RepID=UPI002000DFAA|nr:HAMP domain-containing sensor histidine kinase [Microbacterium aerolatum]MCK3769740.1 HAMP domain-containing histidine kinase [Microbacterium aerolatum]